MTLRRTAIAGLAASALFAFAACGGSDSKSADQESSTGASGAASSSGGSTLAKKIQKTFTDGGAAHISMDMGSTGKAEGDIDFASGKPTMDITLSGGQAGDAEMRLVGGTMYMKSAMAGDKWIKMDTSAMGSAGFDPSTMFDQLKRLKGGTDLGGGHWRLDEGGGVTADLYFDDDDLLQKSVVRGATSDTLTIVYTDWGKKVDVQAPPSSDVVDMGSMSLPTIPSMSAQ